MKQNRGKMMHQFVVVVVVAILVTSASVDLANAVSGCRDGSREGFFDLVQFPKIAACKPSAICDSNPPTNWTDVYLKQTEKQICGECKVLVSQMDTKYSTCDKYCAAQNLKCTGAWESDNFNCAQHTNDLTCSNDFKGHLEGICECSTEDPATRMFGTDVTSTDASANFCSEGWHICTGKDINAGRGDVEHHTAITIADATNFSGCYGYNANNDCNSCQDTCGSRTDGGHSGTGCNVGGGSDPDIAGMGSACSKRSGVNACLSNGRLNLKNGNGCSLKAETGASGLVCCRDDYLELKLSAAASKEITVDGKKQTYQIVYANKGIDFYSASLYAMRQREQGMRGHLAVFDSTVEVNAVQSLLADNKTSCDGFNTSKWIDVDRGLVCGTCKVLATNMRVHKTCNNYCATQPTPLFCAGAWEDVGDSCEVKFTTNCANDFGTFTSDAICECSETAGAEGQLWVGGHEAWLPNPSARAWYWSWAGASVAGKFHQPFGYSFQNGSTSFPSNEHLEWATDQPGATPLQNGFRCTYVDGTPKLNAQGCSVGGGMDGFVVEYTEPTFLTTCAGGHVYEVNFLLLDWDQALEYSEAYSYNSMPGHLLTLDSAAEADCITQWLTDLNVGLGYTSSATWTAGTPKTQISNQWVWDAGPNTGQPITLNSWADGEPAVGGTARGLGLSADGKWRAEHTSTPMLSIIEYEPLSADVLVLLNGETYSGSGPWKSEVNDYTATYTTANHPNSFNNATHTFGFNGYNGEDALTVDFDLGPGAHPNLTIEVWFKLDADYHPENSNGWIVGHDDGGYDRSLVLTDPRYNGMGQGVGFVYQTGLGYPSYGEWHHGIAVFAQGVDGGSFVALDGQIGNKVTANNGEGTKNFSLGGLVCCKNHGIDGDVAYVKIYGKALSDDEISIRFKAFADRMVKRPDPVQPPNVDDHRGFKVGQVVANLRADMDYALKKKQISEGSSKVPCMGQGGQWNLYSSQYIANGTLGSKTALRFTAQNTGVVTSNAFVDRSSTNQYHLPGVSNNYLLTGEATKTDANEVTLHPGNSIASAGNGLLVVEFKPSASGWYIITGSLRNLGTDVDSTFVDLLWTDPNGNTNSETLGKIGKAVEAFQRTMWMGVDMSFSVVVGSSKTYYADMSALTLIISAADNFSPFDFGLDGSNVTKLGAVILRDEEVDLSKQYFYRGVGVQYSRDVPDSVSDPYSIEVNTMSLSAQNPVTNVSFSATVNVSCGDTVHYSAWVRIKEAKPTTTAACLDSIGLATRTSKQTPWHVVSCEDQLDNVASKYTCLARIGYLRSTRGMSEREARHRVGKEFPTECGACAELVSPSELAQCPETLDWLDDVKDVYANNDLYGGNFTCSSRIEWLKKNRNQTQEEAMILVASEFPDACGCLKKLNVGNWVWIHGTKQILAAQAGVVTQLEVGLVAVEAGLVFQFTDFDVVKMPMESENNLGSESTASDVTPPGFFVGGYHELLDLTYNYTNPEKTVTAVYSSDVPDDAVDPRSIEFTVEKPGPWIWAGYNVPICKGDLMRFSVWLKFIDTVPRYGNASCFVKSSGHTPLNGVADQGRTVAASAQACQQRCATTTGCGYFSYWPDGGCHITNANAKINTNSANGAVISGPKSCGDNLQSILPGTYSITFDTKQTCEYTIYDNGLVTTSAACAGGGGWKDNTAVLSANTLATDQEFPWIIGEGLDTFLMAQWTLAASNKPQLKLKWFKKGKTYCCSGTGLGDISIGQFAKPTGGGGIGLKHHATGAGDSGDVGIYSEFLPSMKPNEWTYVSKTWTADYTQDDLLIFIMDSAPQGQRARFCDLRATKLVHEPVLFFGGDNGYVQFADASGLPVDDSAYTIEAWVKSHDHTNNGIVGWGNWNVDNAATSLRLDKGGAVRHSWRGNDLLVTNIGDLEDDTWHHIAATYDGTNRTLVVDGIERRRDVPSIQHRAVAADFRIGSTEESFYFVGGIAEVRVWAVARSAAEIHAYMQSEIDAEEEGLVGYWPLNDGGNSVRDISPSANNGLLVGDVSYHSHDSFPPIYRGLDAEYVVTVDDETGVTLSGDWEMVNAIEGKYLVAGDGYTLCAVENKFCACVGKVRYGANGAFNYKQSTGNISCSNSVFGDPIYGTVKKCHCLSTDSSDAQRIQFEVDVPVAGAYDVAVDMIYRGDAPNVTVVHRSGLSLLPPTQQKSGWASVGDFRFLPGPALVIIARNSGTTQLSIHGVKLAPASGDDVIDNPRGWNGQCKIINTEYTPGMFHYQVIPDVLPTRAVTFSVKAANDAHVGLFVKPMDAQQGDLNVMYEIVIGGWANQQSVIRRSPQGANLVVVKTSNILDKNTWRQFWITFSGGVIKVGTGLVPGVAKTVVMQYKDPVPLPVAYVGVGTGFNSGGAFDVCSVHDGDVISGDVRCGADEFVKDNTTCQKLKLCEVGQEEMTAATATSDRVCKDCPSGTTDADSNWKTECLTCIAGHYTKPKSAGSCNNFKCSDGTTTSDASVPCQGCPQNTYAKGGWKRCWPWRNCTKAGTEEKPGSATPSSDRVCQSCVVGSTFRSNSMTKCGPVVECAADEYETVKPTTTSDRVCTTRVDQKCTNGQYLKDNNCVDCAKGSSDQDFNFSTPCDVCPIGAYVPEVSSGSCSRFVCHPGTADLDRNPATLCVPCKPLTSYQNTSNASSCIYVGRRCGVGKIEDTTKWTVDYITKNGATFPRPCVPCGPNTYKSAFDRTCMPINASCDRGYEEATPPSITRNRGCRSCAFGKFSSDGSACQPWTRCELGWVQTEGPTSTHDRVCKQSDITTVKPPCDPKDLNAFVDCLIITNANKDALRQVFAKLGITTLRQAGNTKVQSVLDAMGELNPSSDRSVIARALRELRDNTIQTTTTPKPTSTPKTRRPTVATTSAPTTLGGQAYCYKKSRTGGVSPVDTCDRSVRSNCWYRDNRNFNKLTRCSGVCINGVCDVSAIDYTSSTTKAQRTTKSQQAQQTTSEKASRSANANGVGGSTTPASNVQPSGSKTAFPLGGVVVGGLGGLVIIVLVVFFICRRGGKGTKKYGNGGTYQTVNDTFDAIVDDDGNMNADDDDDDMLTVLEPSNDDDDLAV